MFLALTRVFRNLATNCVQNKSLKTRNDRGTRKGRIPFMRETFEQMREGKYGKSGRLVKPDCSGRF